MSLPAILDGRLAPGARLPSWRDLAAQLGVARGTVREAYERLADSAIERIVVTDTLPLRPGAPDNITVLSTASTFADSIRRIFTDDSVSEIFAGENQLF